MIPEREWRIRERANIVAALELAKNRVSGAGGAAVRLGIHPATLASRLKGFGIRPKSVLPPEP